MKLCDMARPKQTVKETAPTTENIEPYYEKYPYGLRINLNQDDLAKLGIDISSYKVDEDMSLQCEATVIGIRQNQTSDGNEDCSMELQITKMGMKGMGNFGDSFDEAVNEK